MNYSATLTQPKTRNPILGMLPVHETCYHRKILKEVELGFVDSATAEEDPILTDMQNWIDLQKMRGLHGYDLKNESCIAGFSNPFYVSGAGSIIPHKDTGLGLTINILVSTKHLSRTYQSEDDCMLFAQGKYTKIKVGHVFLLNTNVEHAWMANCRWLILGQAIKKRRRC